MDDSELAAIRAARLAELQRNAQGGGSQAQENKTNQNDPSQSILSQILEPEAKERLSRVRMVRPERVTSVESYLLRLFKSGAIRTKISESEIVEILERVSKEERKGNETKIVFDRRSTHYEDEDEGEEDDFFD
ncbi:uncharacterized protein OGAPODRAFT_6679 [Ogataea polymorpha]|uniref:uncharacterized protein n=1 Tax=Ogataea polymorpha TaxID=460523 RepID=UPI0007F46EF9|nr:uncharacterized protein OGAPODRAFT_6679 [Ogataea polymorpha]OBA17162.1 hypothetical protein OGAPODRAFT_6679 [Ogataea polymorpha]